MCHRMTMYQRCGVLIRATCQTQYVRQSSDTNTYTQQCLHSTLNYAVCTCTVTSTFHCKLLTSTGDSMSTSTDSAVESSLVLVLSRVLVTSLDIKISLSTTLFVLVLSRVLFTVNFWQVLVTVQVQVQTVQLRVHLCLYCHEYLSQV